jgi:hypothetical protein
MKPRRLQRPTISSMRPSLDAFAVISRKRWRQAYLGQGWKVRLGLGWEAAYLYLQIAALILYGMKSIAGRSARELISIKSL